MENTNVKINCNRIIQPNIKPLSSPAKKNNKGFKAKNVIMHALYHTGAEPKKLSNILFNTSLIKVYIIQT